MILIVDNYDSFTFNLVQRLGEIDPSLDIRVVRNDEHTVEELAAMKPDRLIVSPGPCTPSEAGVSVECVQHFAGKLPLLGVCLGHQSIAQALGATIVRAKNLMHGKTDQIHYAEGSRLLAGLDNPFQATRYHSLVIDPNTLPDELVATAWCDEPHGGREIMAVEHKELPLFGVQFHPESFLTHQGSQLLKRFLEL
ncbi:Anthranilate synthase component 2 [Pseudobythopirellula maris]|uniref:Anthranilate synthase component 2 n=1 Tax=Pseudobythopirellula maris TaxID=2527991 RepID=A0A5C5ZND2_9BACT|nr:aminodeoxychorismate/anthranilate synthase component II [Pseudobythopirellula maris]TWT88678.1 Anthranilate synthase component 2 [Pseudobythopirellula maris]